MTSTSAAVPGTPFSAIKSRCRDILSIRANVLVASSLPLVVYLIVEITGALEMGKSPYPLWFLAGALGICLIFAFKQGLKLDWLSAPVVYMVIFWMFHFGLLFPASIAPSMLDELPSWAMDWLFVPETALAAMNSLLFLACFALGFLWIRTFLPETPQMVAGLPHPELIIAGWAVIGIGLALFLASAARFGFGIFLESYEEFYELSNPFAWSVILVSYGLILQAAGGRSVKEVLVASLWCYLPVAAISLLAGARTAPMFTMAAFLVVLNKRGMRIPRLLLILAMIGLLFVFAVVRETRQYGVARLAEVESIAGLQNPLTGMTELGGTLRAVQATIDYTRTEGFFHGETYGYPLSRQIGRFLGNDPGTVWTDRRFIADRINQDYGSIGYSTVAEAYANGGTVGVILFAFFWGAAFKLLDYGSRTPYGLAVFSIVLTPMLIDIRNSFIFVPGWIFLGLIPILGAVVFRRMNRHRADKPALLSRA